MEQFELRSLDGVSIRTLYETFIQAFADYSVDLSMDEEAFALHLRRNAFDPALSAGLFDSACLKGFVLNGKRMYDGRLSVYDLGTGLVPEVRGKRLSSALFSFLFPLLRQNGIEAWVLEVIRTNTRAVRLYDSLGFRITREFSCFSIDRKKLEVQEKVKAEAADSIDALPAFYDSPPSFQNSRQAVKDAGGYAAVRVKDYTSALFNPRTGSIAEISVRPDMRCRGTGESLLACIKRECTGRTIRIVNVGAESLKSFLLGRGFELFAEQREMIRLL